MRAYMAAAMLAAGRAGSGFKGGNGANGNPGSVFEGENTGFSRSGRGVTSASTPTTLTEDNDNPFRGWYPCKTCCNACQRNAPQSWNVTIPGSAGTVVVSRVRVPGVGSNVCRWQWNGRQTSGCAAHPWMTFIQLQASTTQWQLSVQGPDGQLFNWFILPGGEELDCGSAIEGWGTYSLAMCPEPGTPTVSPGEDGTCCGCVGCCDACDDFTPLAWKVTIDERTFIVPRLVQVGDGPDACFWQSTLADEEFCGAEARTLLVNVSGGAANVVLKKPDGTTHTTWTTTVDEPADCQQTYELEYDSGACSGIPRVTLTPTRLKYCPQGSGDCQECVNDDSPAEIDINLGVGGLTNCAGDNCAGIAGVFTLARAEPSDFVFACSGTPSQLCMWRYYDENFQTVTPSGTCTSVGGTGALEIALYRFVSAAYPGKVGYFVIVWVGGYYQAMYCDQNVNHPTTPAPTQDNEDCTLSASLTLYKWRQYRPSPCTPGTYFPDRDCGCPGLPFGEDSLCNGELGETITVQAA